MWTAWHPLVDCKSSGSPVLVPDEVQIDASQVPGHVPVAPLVLRVCQVSYLRGPIRLEKLHIFRYVSCL